MDDKFFELLLAIIPVVCTIITAYIVPFIKSKIKTEKLHIYEYWTELAVKSAEMIWKDADKSGKIKKEYVKQFLNNLFGKEISDEQIDVLIEAFVKNLKLEENK